MSNSSIFGLHGKIPAHGDFIDRNLPIEFIGVWDEWLQSVLARSIENLGSNWLDLYLTSPIWRFVLSPNSLYGKSWAGILVPSVDSVGRYFPLTIASNLTDSCGPNTFLLQNNAWFQSLEAAAAAALQERLTADQLCERMRQIPSNLVTLKPSSRQVTNVAQAENLGLAMASHMDTCTSITQNGFSLWQSSYSDPTLHNLLRVKGMPSADQFTAFIDGQWSKWGWQLV